MKKTLITAITTALVVGAASTTFAAANPFSDVPANHWSYDAVSKLAKDGVIEGYGDGSFRGDQKITRYEMAQMVAKAMTKSDVSAADKAMIDKLSAEYADELNNLGVRVANLEKKSDNVKFNGLMRLEGTHYNNAYSQNDNKLIGNALLRLELTAAVNDDWVVKGRLDGQSSLNNDTGNLSTATGTANSKDSVTAKRIYAQGPLLGGTVKLGKFGTFDNAALTNGGLIIDREVSGAEFAFGKTVRTTLTYARLQNGSFMVNGSGIGSAIAPAFSPSKATAGSVSNYAAAQFSYAPTSRLTVAAGYTNLNNEGFKNLSGTTGHFSKDNYGFWNAGFDYKFTKDLTFGGVYVDSNADVNSLGGVDSNEAKSYSVQLTYKAAKASVPGSYGLWAAYRQLGTFATVYTTLNGAEPGTKGYELGVNYMLDKNILSKTVYYDGQNITGNKDIKKIFERIEFAF